MWRRWNSSSIKRMCERRKPGPSGLGTRLQLTLQERQQRVAAAQDTVNTHQLSLRVAGERYGLPKSTVYRHVLNEDVKVQC